MTPRLLLSTLSTLSTGATAAALLLSCPVLSQQGPAPELQKFERMLGTWEGKGTAKMQPGMPPAPWTSKSSTRWALDGHAVCDDMVVEFPGMGMPPMFMRTYTTWDSDYKKFRVFSLNSLGHLSTSDVYWEGDTLVQFSTGIQEGTPYSERWINQYAEDAVEFESLKVLGTGEPFTEIVGTAKRISKTPKQLDITAYGAFIGTAAGEEMKRVTRGVGHYAMKGTSTQEPDGEAMSLSGTTTVRSLFDGLVLAVEDKGESVGYASEHYLAWAPERNCYTHVAINNFGFATFSEAVWMNNSLVFTDASRMMGEPAVDRTIIHYDDHGRLQHATSHVTKGAAAPFQTFSGRWTLKAMDGSHDKADHDKADHDKADHDRASHDKKGGGK